MLKDLQKFNMEMYKTLIKGDEDFQIIDLVMDEGEELDEEYLKEVEYQSEALNVTLLYKINISPEHAIIVNPGDLSTIIMMPFGETSNYIC